MMALYQLTLAELMIIYNLAVSSIPVCNFGPTFCHHQLGLCVWCDLDSLTTLASNPGKNSQEHVF